MRIDETNWRKADWRAYAKRVYGLNNWYACKCERVLGAILLTGYEHTVDESGKLKPDKKTKLVIAYPVKDGKDHCWNV